MDEDWDTLLILDACRYDQFDRIADHGGRLESRTSLGSCTTEFLSANFEGRSHCDTVYITANPVYRTGEFDGVFHDIVDVLESDWDEQNRTVHPEEMVRATKQAHETYPHKRLVAHFVQPHYPFIGASGQALADSVGGALSGLEGTDGFAEDETRVVGRMSPWDLLEEGILDLDDVRRAYDENLRLVLSHVETLLADLPGKTVITSDHGNLLGEEVSPISGPVFGHPSKTYTEELRKVPWLVVNGVERKRIRDGDPAATRTVESNEIEDRLADLG